MNDHVEVCQSLVREIQSLGLRWDDWRRGEQRQSRAVELLCGTPDPRQGPEILVGREEFSIAGEVMVCLHPGCGGFIRGLIRCGAYVYWTPHCECPHCGQRYALRDF